MAKLLSACLLLFLAIGSAVVIAYGTNPDLGRYTHGVDWIVFTRRLQWPLVALSIACCMILIASVIANTRRAWWLVGLAPVVALFAHRFSFAEQNYFTVADVSHEIMLRAEEVSFLADDDWVVGVIFDGEPYAYPYRALYSTPVVVHSEREKRMVLIWSPFANFASALMVSREFKARDLDIVSMPANATLVFNARLGEFINGITCKTSRGEVPHDVLGTLPTTRTPWKRWKTAHPETLVMPPMGRSSNRAPGAPVLPHYPLPKDVDSSVPANARITIIPSGTNVAILSETITTTPINLLAGNLPVLIFRDPATGELRAFDRRIEEDLSPRFHLNTENRKIKGAYLVDADTHTFWSTEGVAVDGDKDRKGQRLKFVPVVDDLYWGTMKTWLPELQLIDGRPR